MPFVQDTFTDTDGTNLSSHTGEIGATWTQRVSGRNAVITDANRVRGDTSNAAEFQASGTPATAEYNVSGDFYAKSLAGRAGTIGRIDPTSTGSGSLYGYMIRYRQSAAAWQLLEWTAGSAAEIASSAVTLSTDTTYVSRLEIRDDRKEMFIDNVSKGSGTNNAVTAAGVAGVYFHGDGGTPTNTTHVHLDNFDASNLGGGSFLIPNRARRNVLLRR